MKLKLIELLETTGYNVHLQGTVSDYPDHFFTYWNNDVPEQSHYDNKPTSFVWNFDVNFYSKDPVKVNTMFDTIRPLLKQNGFIVIGKGYDVMSDEPSHTGRGLNVLYIEREV